MQKFFIGSDHAGFELKSSLITALSKEGIAVEDFGTNRSDPTNYAPIAHKVAEAVKNNPTSKGILICGAGIGMSITANRHKGIRAALCHDTYTTQCARSHNDANIMVLGGRVLDEETALNCLKVFLETPFEGGRHGDRIREIEG